MKNDYVPKLWPLKILIFNQMNGNIYMNS